MYTLSRPPRLIGLFPLLWVHIAVQRHRIHAVLLEALEDLGARRPFSPGLEGSSAWIVWLVCFPDQHPEPLKTKTFNMAVAISHTNDLGHAKKYPPLPVESMPVRKVAKLVGDNLPRDLPKL